jgi:hypothetical protein
MHFFFVLRTVCNTLTAHSKSSIHPCNISALVCTDQQQLCCFGAIATLSH